MSLVLSKQRIGAAQAPVMLIVGLLPLILFWRFHVLAVSRWVMYLYSSYRWLVFCVLFKKKFDD